MLSNFVALAATETPKIGSLGVVEFILGIALMVMAVFLIIAVLLQSGKDKGMMGHDHISTALDSLIHQLRSAVKTQKYRGHRCIV